MGAQRKETPRARLTAGVAVAALLAVTCILGMPAEAHAQTNYDGALIGGRSSLLGGTGVAAGTDAAAPLQNPATTVDIQGTSFVFSTFFLQLAQRQLDVTDDIAAEVASDSVGLKDTQVRVLPNATCLFADFFRRGSGRDGKHKFSLCFTEPESANYEMASSLRGQTELQTGYQSRSMKQTFRKRVYAASWAHALSEEFSFGVTTKVHDVTFRDLEAISTVTSDASLAEDIVGSAGASNTSIFTNKASALAMSALVGVQHVPARDWRFGASLETPSLHLFGNYEATRSAEATTGAKQFYEEESGTARFNYPWRVALGISGKVGRTSFEADGFFHTGRGDYFKATATRETVQLVDNTITSLTSDDARHVESVRPVVNFGLGFEYPFSESWALLTGLSTDFAGLSPRTSGPASDDVIFRNRVDSLHGAVGVAWTPPLGSILLGVRGHYGEGELLLSRVTEVPIEQFAAKQSVWGIALVLSGQLSLEMLAVVDPTGLLEKDAKSAAPDKDSEPAPSSP